MNYCYKYDKTKNERLSKNVECSEPSFGSIEVSEIDYNSELKLFEKTEEKQYVYFTHGDQRWDCVYGVSYVGKPLKGKIKINLDTDAHGNITRY